MDERGFTLIEIVMVIGLVGILAAFVYPSMVDFRDDAKAAVTKDRLNEMRMAISGDPRSSEGGVIQRRGFFRDTGTLPSALNDLVVQGAFPTYDPLVKRGWNGPYIEATVGDWNKDAWGQAFVYSSSSRSIRSCGVNKVCADADDLIVNF